MTQTKITRFSAGDRVHVDGCEVLRVLGVRKDPAKLLPAPAGEYS
jgi:hypothetical protein